MTEHTCTAESGFVVNTQDTLTCPGCQAQDALFKAERAVLEAALALSRQDTLPFLRTGDDNDWANVYRLGREYLLLKGELPAVTLHLYEFDSSGYYAAESKEAACALCNADVGDDVAADDFVREVPDDEPIEVTIEIGDKWDDPREYSRPIKPQQGHSGMIDVIWCLKLTAREWANEHGHKQPGYCFGGDC